MLGRLRAEYKKLLSHFKCINEFCHDCGRDGYVPWLAADALWLKVMSSPRGTLCPECFDKRAREAGIFCVWRPEAERTVMTSYGPRPAAVGEYVGPDAVGGGPLEV